MKNTDFKSIPQEIQVFNNEVNYTSLLHLNPLRRSIEAIRFTASI